MQLLIDSTQETPASLRFAANVLAQLADLMVPVELVQEAPSINGPSAPIVLHAHGPAAPIDPQPVVTTDVAQMDPAAVFQRANLYAGAIHQNVVPAGTIAPLAPPAPVVTAPAAPAAPSAVASDAANGTPTTPADSTASATTAGAVDKDGIPWDARVHSETRKLNADGTWRYRRNLDPTVKTTVAAELKALFQNTPPASPQLPLALPAPAPEAPPAPPAPVAPQPPAAAVPVPNAVSMGVPNAPQPPVLSALGFRDFMSIVSKARAAGKITEDQLTTACKAVNVDSITALASEPGKVGLVHNQIAHLLGEAAA